MKGSRRMLDDGAHSEVHDLLLAGMEDPPPEGGPARVLEALGIASAVGVAGAAAAASGGKSVLGVSTSTLVKLLGAGIVTGGAVMGTIAASQPGPEAPPSNASQVAVTAPPTQRPTLAVAEPPQAKNEQPRADVTSPPGLTSTRPSVASSPPFVPSSREPVQPSPAQAASTNTEPAPDLLRAEVALLDDVRKKMASGDSVAALSLLDRFRRDFPSGRLTPEAEILRIEALMAANRRREALALAHRRLESQPQGRNADRIRSLVGGDQDRKARE